MENTSTILLGGGNFWITEAIFKGLNGVLRVIPGYTGGNIPHPVYRQVCSGKTGHVEGVKVFFDPEKIDLSSILSIFFEMHDPTLIDKQGVEKGSQFRSYIGCQTLEQLHLVQKYCKTVQKEKEAPIATQAELNFNFYEAEYYHHNYYEIQNMQPYAQRIIAPLLEKIRLIFKDYYKTPLLAS